MKIFLDYKKGWFGRFRELNFTVCLSNRRVQRTEVEIPDETEYLFGEMDWVKTEKIEIEDLSDGDCIELVPYFSWKHADSYRRFGKILPIRIVIRNKDGFQK